MITNLLIIIGACSLVVYIGFIIYELYQICAWYYRMYPFVNPFPDHETLDESTKDKEFYNKMMQELVEESEKQGLYESTTKYPFDKGKSHEN